MADNFYYGSAENKLNSKGQVAIPARFRLAGGEEGRDKSYVLVPGEGNCLYLYAHRQFARIKDNARKVAEENDDIVFYRRFMAEAHAVEVDTQGRFVVPQALLRAAGIKGPALLFIGMDDRVEIWDPGAYEGAVGDGGNYKKVRDIHARRIFGI